jgi:hypothetical protein
MKINTQTTITSVERTISILDLFSIDYKSKYLFVNLYSTTGYGDQSNFIVDNKTLLNTRFLGNNYSKTIIYTLTNGDYVSNLYGSLSKLTVQTSTYKNNIDLVTVKTVVDYDKSYYTDIINMNSVFHEAITGQEYSTAIYNSTDSVLPTSKANLISLANSYVGTEWNITEPWAFVETLAIRIGTTLPFASMYATDKSTSNGSWVLKYDGGNPKGDWRTLATPGDIIILSDEFDTTDALAVVTSGSGKSIKVIDTARNSSNYNNGFVKILPEHLLSTEDVYDVADDNYVYIFTLDSSIKEPVVKPQPPVVPTPIIVNETSNNPYSVKGKYNTVYVKPMDDIYFGANQYFKKTITGFSCSDVHQKLKLTIDNLPSWCKFNAVTNTISGTTPNVSSNTTIKLKATYGGTVVTDLLNVSVDIKQLVDIKDVSWTANKLQSLSIDKGMNAKYYFSVSDPVDLKWLKIDQTLGTIYGKPPLDLSNHNAHVTVWQQDSLSAPKENIDTFSIHIDQPINIVGMPLI